MKKAGIPKDHPVYKDLPKLEDQVIELSPTPPREVPPTSSVEVLIEVPLEVDQNLPPEAPPEIAPTPPLEAPLAKVPGDDTTGAGAS